MKVLGIDPGTRVVGYGLIDKNIAKLCLLDYGIIKVTNSIALPKRLKEIYEALELLYRRLQPDAVVVENIFYARDVRATIKMGEARGVILLSTASHQIPVYEYTPAEVKKAVTGNGRADKSQVQKMVQLLLALKTLPQPYDASDALALALCHIYRT